MKYSIVFPCKNEEHTVGVCISKAKRSLPGSEVIVVDNNSTDGSARIAKESGAIVVREPVDGYGAALLRGFDVSSGEWVIMCDADNTYDIAEVHKLLKHSKGYDIIIGNRLNAGMKDGAMPFMHRYIGNPLLGFLMRRLFHTKIRDVHSGFRVIRRSALRKLNLESTGMELASEMLIKASQHGLKVKEINITYHTRVGESKLRSFNDGWKHLKMMLLYSPNHLFLIPGLSLFILGLIILIGMLAGPVTLFGVKADIHPTIIGSLATILGYEIILLWLYSTIYRFNILGDTRRDASWLINNLSLERSIILGTVFFIIGLAISAWIIFKWVNGGFGELFELRRAIFAMTVIIIGIQTIFSGFLLSMLGTKLSR